MGLSSEMWQTQQNYKKKTKKIVYVMNQHTDHINRIIFNEMKINSIAIVTVINFVKLTAKFIGI